MKTIRAKIFLYVVVSATLLVASTIVLLTTRTVRSARTAAEDLGAETAGRYANAIDAEFERAMGLARTLAQVFGEFGELKREDRRANYTNVLKSAALQNPDCFAVWSIWERNAIDGMDAKYAGVVTNNNVGRFEPCWYRTPSGIKLEPSGDEAEMADADYYNEPKTMLREAVIEPYSYSYEPGTAEVFEASLVVPILHDGRFYGVVGTDISFEPYQKLVDSIKPFETGYGAVLSNAGVFVAHPDKALVGKTLGDLLADPALLEEAGRAMKEGRECRVTHGGNRLFFVPFSVGGSASAWSFMISVPQARILERAGIGQTVLFAVLLGVGLIGVLGAVLWVIVSRVSSNLGKVNGMLGEIARGGGDLTRRITVGSRDEARELADRFNAFCGNLADIVRSLKNSIGEAVVAKDTLARGAKAAGDAVRGIARASGVVEEKATRLAADISQSTASAQGIDAAVRGFAQQVASQASAVEESTAAIEEMTASIANIARVSEEKKGLTESLAKATEEGGAKVEESGTLVEEVAAGTDEILAIIQTIQDVSRTAGTLALNAAIEAAHAGEAGKGFSVVADEIGKLSSSTQENARQIATIIERSVGKIRGALAASSSSRESFQTIEVQVKEVSRAFAEISGSMAELNIGAGEILKAITVLSQSSVSVRDGSGEIESGVGVIAESLRSIKETAEGVLEASRAIFRASQEIAAIVEKDNEMTVGLGRTVDEMQARVAHFVTE